ncbi:YopX family protein [Mammaliicoccus sciuri]|uniref:YopX family protein n=1 Tax=Mammaliicoccus sciuri TaxID=1296 RepID=UPI003AC142B2
MIPKVIAWDKVNKEMIEDVASIHFKSEMIVTRNLCFYPFKDIKLLQSTGLLDKNGKEIFEGDIVKVKAEDVESKIHSDRYQVGMVIYTYGSFDIQTNDGTFTGLIPESNLTDILLTFEVLGNKFEHPHLLEEN